MRYDTMISMRFSVFFGISISIWTRVDSEFVCSLPGTCFAPNNPSIDLRIVVPVPTETPQCLPGFIPCEGIVIPQCGVQYVDGISTANGQSTPGAYPWQAFIKNQSGFTGSGVLLDNQHVLTAAHKVDKNLATPQNVEIRLGVWNPSDYNNNLFRTAQQIILHPTYNSENLADDIAIIRLNAPVLLATSPFINPICLPEDNNNLQQFTGKRCIVSGWGQTDYSNENSALNPLKQVEVPIVDFNTCFNSFIKLIGVENTVKYLSTPRNLCAGGEERQDACTNDGGGPLMCKNSEGRFVVTGLVLWGKGCGSAGVYGAYANVANYRNWIEGVLNSA